MDRPRVFIGSSQNNVRVARAVQANLSADVEARLWNQGIFHLSKDNLSNILDELEQADFGVFILGADDEAIIKDESVKIPRDNVIFEFGIYVGRLGPFRAFAIIPPKTTPIHILSDFHGLTVATLQEVSDDNLFISAGPACTIITEEIQRLGRSRKQAAAQPSAPRVDLRDARYEQLLASGNPEIYIEKLIRTDDLLANGDDVTKEKFIGLRAFSDKPIAEVSSTIRSSTGHPCAPEVLCDTPGFEVAFEWEQIGTSGPVYPAKTLFKPPLSATDCVTFRRNRLLQNAMFWNQRDRLEATNRRSNKENVSQRIRQAQGYLDLRVIFPAKHYPSEIHVLVKDPQGDIDRAETLFAQNALATVEQSRTVLLPISKPLLHFEYVIEWNLPEEDTTVPRLELKYSGFVEEMIRRLVDTRFAPSAQFDIGGELQRVQASMEAAAPQVGIAASAFTLFLYDRSRGGLICVATTDKAVEWTAVGRYLFRPGSGVPGRAYRMMETIVYANLPAKKVQVEIYETIPPGLPKPENVVVSFPLFHHSSKFRCIGVLTVSSYPKTTDLTELLENSALQTELGSKANEWYNALLGNWGDFSSTRFWVDESRKAIKAEPD
jgi:hypothetical protein